MGVKHSRDPLLGMALPLSTARGQRETHVVPLLFPVQPTHKIFEGTSKTSRKMELKDISVLAKNFFFKSMHSSDLQKALKNMHYTKLCVGASSVVRWVRLPPAILAFHTCST